MTNVDYPAPEVAGNTETHPRLVGIMFGAMSQCVPDRVMAAESATGGNFGFRLGKSLALGMVRPAVAAIGTNLTMDILGERHRVTIIPESPYDSENQRLRS